MQAKSDFKKFFPNGQKARQLNTDITRPAAPGDTCYHCGAEIGGNVTERSVSVDEVHFICEFCELDPDAPIPFLPRPRYVRRLAVYCEPDAELCRIVAANSGRNGDAVLRHLAANELQRRRELQAAIDYLREAVGR